MRRNLVPVAVVLILLTMLSLSAAAGPEAGQPPATMPPPGRLVWADEFEGAAGSEPDPEKWRTETGGGGWGNEELQYYTDSTRNAALDGEGHLAITARRESPVDASCHYGSCLYTSARLISADRFSQAYGRFEARLLVPAGQGFWPAFWMLGENVYTDGWPLSGEIDIMEYVGKDPRTVFGSLHGPGYSGEQAATGSYDLPGGQEVGDGFHVFTVDWAPNSVTWYVDGVAYQRKTGADVGGTWVFDHKFFLLLNLAVGGQWPGPPDDDTAFPQSLVVDYVRVHQLAGPPGTEESSIRGFGDRCIGTQGPAAAGAPLVLEECGAAGRWVFPADGTALSAGQCMTADAVASSTTAVDSGVRVRLSHCDGGPGQQFRLTKAGALVNPRSGKCVDVAGRDPDSGPWLQLWDCAGSANQKWTRAT